ncbi:Piwi domain-containing protein [Pseudidiomarina sp. WS423]|uniref:Piwi domain-containing protein n=1 Tax=Pseudidiomarina sp. WS423 TaxID=3425124 RepID=UPI003D6F4E49
MQRLLINRISLVFNAAIPVTIVARKTDTFSLSKNRAGWIRDKLSGPQRERFLGWMKKLDVKEGDFVATEFRQQVPAGLEEASCISIELEGDAVSPFKHEIFKQEFGAHLQSKQFFVEPIRKSMSFSAYQNMGQFDADYDQYRRIDFNWKSGRSELVLNLGSEKTLVTKMLRFVADGQSAFNLESHLVYRKHGGIMAKCFCPGELRRQRIGAPQKFSYRDRFERLKGFAAEHLYDLESPFFSIDRTGFRYVDPDSFQNVLSQQNLMAFGGEKTAINAVVGMREYGPLKKAEGSERKRLLFIYQNRNDANTLYRYLKNGLKHFPGLLSYVGIPVALAGPDKGLPYQDVNRLPDTLKTFLDEHYSDPLYPDMLAIVIGPFKRYESDEAESDSYFQIKKILLDRGIASQFISPDTINNYGVHYSLPNIAIAILAKFGGVPWKLSKKKSNELIVGFNTKLVEGDRYLGSAVFFDNEGRLGGVKGLPVDDKTAIIRSLKEAITEYTNQVGMPERLVVHYYKPPRKDEISNILKMLEDMSLSVPVAVVEVNDSKSKLDICFDADFNMGMPESGVFVKTGFNEYLLFNNNRYKKSPPRKIDDELPIKLRLSHVNTGGFTAHELIAQVYEFSRLNWKGLRQRSVPVTTTYAKTIAEFSSHFEGEIPGNEVANNIPWFI